MKLGRLHEDGVLKKSSRRTAFGLYKKCYTQSESYEKEVKGRSSYSLARCYAEGIGVKANERRRIEWIGLSVDAGYVPAMFELANLHLSGAFDSANRKEGGRLMSKAAKAKYVPALFWFARYHLENDKPNEAVFDWLKEQARDGNVKARELMRSHDIPYWEISPESEESDDEEESVIIDMGIAGLGHDAEFDHDGLNEVFEVVVLEFDQLGVCAGVEGDCVV